MGAHLINGDEKIKFLKDRGWTESCIQDGYWNPPKGIRLPSSETPTDGSGWNMAVALRLVVTTDEALAYERNK
jgi:hypothetical protein